MHRMYAKAWPEIWQYQNELLIFYSVICYDAAAG